MQSVRSLLILELLRLEGSTKGRRPWPSSSKGVRTWSPEKITSQESTYDVTLSTTAPPPLSGVEESCHLSLSGRVLPVVAPPLSGLPALTDSLVSSHLRTGSYFGSLHLYDQGSVLSRGREDLLSYSVSSKYGLVNKGKVTEPV